MQCSLESQDTMDNGYNDLEGVDILLYAIQVGSILKKKTRWLRWALNLGYSAIEQQIQL